MTIVCRLLRRKRWLVLTRCHFCEFKFKGLHSGGGGCMYCSEASPQGESVLALQFTGGISDQEGAIWSVSQLLVDFLSANTMTRMIPARTLTDQLRSDTMQEHFSISRTHLEISPQYHSASVSRLLVSVRADGAIFDLAGFAGRTANKQRSQEAAVKKDDPPVCAENQGGTPPSSRTWRSELLLFCPLDQQRLHHEATELLIQRQPADGQFSKSQRRFNHKRAHRM